MTVLSHPYDASASRPVSAFCALDKEEEDPWAVPVQTPTAAAQTMISQNPREPVESVGDGDGDQGSSQDASRYGAVYSDDGIARQSRASDEAPRKAERSSSLLATPTPSLPPSSKHGKTASVDPWATGSTASSAWAAPRSSARPAVPPPPSSSSIRGGFAGSSYAADDEDGHDRHRLPPPPRSPPRPLSWVAVELRPDIEGLIFKYNSYNVIRRPLSTADDADDLSSSSARLLETTRKTRFHSSRSREIPRPTSASSVYTPLATSLASASVSAVHSTVVRRYSDFVWLNEILLKRYPFRLVPVLPPKRLSIPVAGRNLSDGFIEKRRRGLQRYLHAIISHPVLSADDVVQVFLSDKQPISEYKLSHPNISLDEESTITPPPSSVLNTVPRDLSTKLDLTATQTPSMVDKWISLCTLFERIAKRIESQGGDYSRLGSLIDAITQGGGGGLGRASSPSSGGAVAAAHSAPAISLGLASSLHRDFADLCTVRSRSLTLHALEGLKSQRDLWLSWRDLLSRHTSLSGDTVPALKTQVAATRSKLAQLAASTPAQRPPTFHSDVARVEEQLRSDLLHIERLLQRRERVRLAMWEELGLLAARKEEVGGVWREWCKEELLGRAAQKRAVEECWARMSGGGVGR